MAYPVATVNPQTERMESGGAEGLGEAAREASRRTEGSVDAGLAGPDRERLERLRRVAEAAATRAGRRARGWKTLHARLQRRLDALRRTHEDERRGLEARIATLESEVARTGPAAPRRARRVLRIALRGSRFGLRQLRRLTHAGLLILGLVPLWSLALLAILVVEAFQKARLAPPARSRRAPARGRPFSVVIPSWNARDLLETYLPANLDVLARDHEDHEVIVVTNGSEDGSREYLQTALADRVRVVEPGRNLGFGAGCNAGVEAARHEHVLLLNNDMLLEEGVCETLRAGFDHEDTFATTAEIRFEDGERRREETGLTRGRLHRGLLTLAHDEPRVDQALPVLWAGGGSSLMRRDRFLELGGFQEIYRPFYVEDVDLSYRAWRRGWSVKFAPGPGVIHRHRGTIGKIMTPDRIRAVVRRNDLVFALRNLTAPRLLLAAGITAVVRSVASLWRPHDHRVRGREAFYALRELWPCLRGRVADAPGRRRTDREVLEMVDSPVRWRDRHRPPAPPQPDAPLSIVAVSPYAVHPISHGGAYYVQHLLRHLARRHHVVLVAFVDSDEEARQHEALEDDLAQVICYRRRHRAIDPADRPHLPRMVLEFEDPEFKRLLEATILKHDARVLQLEYTHLARYAIRSPHLFCALTEIDLWFESFASRARAANGLIERALLRLEEARALRFELSALSEVDAIHVMNPRDGEVLAAHAPQLAPKLFSEAPVGVDLDPARRIHPRAERDRRRLLFVGSFRHVPNVDGALWLTRDIVQSMSEPDLVLDVVGASPPAWLCDRTDDPRIRFRGFVRDLAPELDRAGVFVCSIRVGAGIRIKILEALAAGLPVVTTRLAARGIPVVDGEHLLFAETPDEFRAAIRRLWTDDALWDRLSADGRRLVARVYDWEKICDKLERHYREGLAQKEAVR